MDSDKCAKAGVTLDTFAYFYVDLYASLYSKIVSIVEFAVEVSRRSVTVVDTTKRKVREAAHSTPNFSTGTDFVVVADAESTEQLALGRHCTEGVPRLSCDVLFEAEPSYRATLAASSFEQPAVPAPRGPAVVTPRTDTRSDAVRKASACGHRLVVRPAFVFCRSCARYASHWWVNLHKPCNGPTDQVGNLNRLWQGINPRSGKPFE